MTRQCRPVVSSACILLLLLHLVDLVSCMVEVEPVSPPVEQVTPGTPSTGGGVGSASSGSIPLASPNAPGSHTNSRYCDLTSLSIDKTEFDRRCGPSPDAQGPCFSVHGETSMAAVKVEPWSAPLRMEDRILLEDMRAVTFTVKDPADEFVVHFQDFVGAKLRYYADEKDTGCYKIHLSGNDNSRIYVKVGNADGRDVDTLHYRQTGKRLCGKWIDVTLRYRDDDVTPELHEDDGRGI